MSLLNGMRILDLSTFSPVRFGTTVLADLGADVIQIDRPRSSYPDDVPMLTSIEHPRWLWHSRNKRSIGLNLKQDGARQVLRHLVAEADVVIEGFAPGTAARLGLDYGSLSKVKKDLVYASVTGFGQTGPYAGLGGHEMNYQAMGGVTAAMAAANRGDPAILPFPLSDSVASLYAAVAVLAAVHRRDRTGLGACVDISIQDAVISLFGYDAQYFWRQGIADPSEIEEFGGSPANGAYATSDGKAIVLGAVEPSVWKRFCAAIGRPDLEAALLDPEERERVRRELVAIFGRQSRAHWQTVGEQHQLGLTPVLSLTDLLADPHIEHRGLVNEVEHPTLGLVRQLATPINVDGGVPPSRWFEVPGGHTRALLDELGIDESERTALYEAGAVFDAEPDNP
ncbi:CaiB/BaiF CoA transferase family protein [Acrocarpospora catenulata]|uniref:CaiB/BaiF CoA transferase family protein n=1 Tax=Acrocarpospora catenulata TaxID=2836182 RepID=UPI001BD9CD81|nr:CaiB/BaiF CoA-transferase family protein [Acrocarpospora catenulata]